MWRRAYLFLVLIRLYFALAPSYLHPDENFQGPEVIAGMSDIRRTLSLRTARLSKLPKLQRLVGRIDDALA